MKVCETSQTQHTKGGLTLIYMPPCSSLPEDLLCCSQPVRGAPAEVQMLPNLRILVIRHLCTVGHLLNVR